MNHISLALKQVMFFKMKQKLCANVPNRAINNINV